MISEAPGSPRPTKVLAKAATRASKLSPVFAGAKKPS
jgi:hypothetical protein